MGAELRRKRVQRRRSQGEGARARPGCVAPSTGLTLEATVWRGLRLVGREKAVNLPKVGPRRGRC
jgi:hypothetical protein